MQDLLSYFAVIPHLMRDLPLEVEPTFYAMPNSKEIPDKGLLTSANSGMTDIESVIPAKAARLPSRQGIFQPGTGSSTTFTHPINSTITLL